MQRKARSRFLASCYFTSLLLHGAWRRDPAAGARFSFSLERLTSFSFTGHWGSPGQTQLGAPAGQLVDKYPMISYRLGKQQRRNMTEFNEDIGLVQTENKARSYQSKVNELQQRMTELMDLCSDAIARLPEEHQWYFEARLEKIKNKRS